MPDLTARLGEVPVDLAQARRVAPPEPGDVLVATAFPDVNAYLRAAQLLPNLRGQLQVRELSAARWESMARRKPASKVAARHHERYRARRDDAARLLRAAEDELARHWQAAVRAAPREAELARRSAFGD